MNDWEIYHRRPMIEALAKNIEGIGKILCINPPICPPVHLFFNWRRFYNWLTSSGLQLISPNLSILIPMVWFPNRFTKNQRLRNLHQRMVSRQIRTALLKLRLSLTKKICWLDYPEQISCIGLADEDYVVYECLDAFRYDIKDGSFRPLVEKEELSLLQRADLVFTSSQALYEEKKRLHPNVYYTPNGVNFELFFEKKDFPRCLPAEFLDIKRPIIGFTGNITYFLDFSLLEFIAASRRNWSLVFIGPIDEKSKTKSLGKYPNVYFLGRRKHEELPIYIKGFDIAILPIKINRYLERCNPLTLYEYLAAGTVVVSTNVPEVRKFQDTVFIARSDEEFVSLIEYGLKVDNGERIKCGIEIARKHSWATITKQMVDVITQSFV